MYTPYPLKNPKTHGFSHCQAVHFINALIAVFPFIYKGFQRFLMCKSNCVFYVNFVMLKKPKKPTGFFKTHGFLQFVHNYIF